MYLRKSIIFQSFSSIKGLFGALLPNQIGVGFKITVTRYGTTRLNFNLRLQGATAMKHPQSKYYAMSFFCRKIFVELFRDPGTRNKWQRCLFGIQNHRSTYPARRGLASLCKKRSSSRMTVK